LEQREETHPLNEVVQLGSNYRGATNGRFRCLGGTSTRWGGALLPFLPEDLLARPQVDLEAWPVSLTELAPFLAQIEALFGLDRGPFDEGFVRQVRPHGLIPIGDPDFIVRFAKWPAFKRRNVATLLRGAIDADPDLSVIINATATDFDVTTEAMRLRSTVARHESGRQVKIEPKHTVICAGAIESTRLLLLIDRQNGDRLFAECTALGRFFNDHISLPMAVLNPSRVQDLNRVAGFRFVGNAMRSIRFELAPSVQAAEAVGSAFCHISFQTDRPSGFDSLRDFLRTLQRTGRLRMDLTFAILRDAPYLCRAAFWRYRHHQLRWPNSARYELHVVCEQLPHASNCISLSDKRDIFNNPLPAIDWRVRPSDVKPLAAVKRRFDHYWRRHKLSEIADLEWLVIDDDIEAVVVSNGCDLFHPCSTTRIGDDGKSSVVDRALRVFAIPNLWIASTSVFPSAASANPTLMLMLLAMRLAQRLGVVVRRSPATS
jgi:choline dehydrogenase-like flavoprotein